ncbi:MAG: hypothetical protein B6240_03100 [Desulfobacteraceae bacterium 4572_87]|nr:MAG: hypothetical protein B6240_03100 [Desulfobacteraceae bacterium 4572_87]
MGKVIDLHNRRKGPLIGLTAPEPWRFRKGLWRTSNFVQIRLGLAETLEYTPEGLTTLPPHFSLKGGISFTIRSMFMNRKDEKKMREVYYLVGLTDCMINQVHPILRTDLLWGMYKKVFAMKEALKVHWHGNLDQVLLPIDLEYFDDITYRTSLTKAETMKELYRAIREGTDEMFDILSLEYVFFSPWMGG